MFICLNLQEKFTMAKKNQAPVNVDDMAVTNYNLYLVAVIAVVVSIVIYILYQRRKSIRRSVLLMGLSDSGKTLICSQLLHSKFVGTHTSIAENTGEYIINSKSLRIVDIPGHERLRGKFFDQYKASAKGIVYVIDSLTLQKEVRDVAEFLYVVLTDPAILSAAPKILILCNKQDEMLSKGSNVIKSLLEREMNTLRVTQSSRLESVDNSKKKDVYLGKADKDFDFSAVPPYSVEFGESQASQAQTNIDDLKKWLMKVA